MEKVNLFAYQESKPMEGAPFGKIRGYTTVHIWDLRIIFDKSALTLSKMY
jgi:hypothetical protein